MERLAIAIKTADRVFTQANIVKPTAEIIAQTMEALQSKNEFSAMKKFVLNCIESFVDDQGNTEDNKSSIMAIGGSMPYQSNELLALKIMMLYNPEDGIEGVYNCPFCRKAVYARKEDDTMDYIHALPIVYADDTEYFVELKEPVSMKLGQEWETVRSLNARYSIVEDMEKSYHLVNNPIRMQWAVNKLCITKINGNLIDEKWRKTWGDMLFMGMTCREDLNAMQRAEKKIGLQTTVEKFCNSCKIPFNVRVNTANFFVSGLE
jgi:hypothetical protein